MNLLGKVIAIVLVISICVDASAEMINYDDFDVTTVTFQDIQESAAEAFYGEPTPADNSLLFNPVCFGVTSRGIGNNSCSSSLTATITANQGLEIENIEIFEAGNYLLSGQGTSATSVDVTISGSVSILEINGHEVDPDYYTTSFSKNFLSANRVDNGLSGDFWSGKVFQDFDSLVGPVTKLSISINNTLAAASEVGTVALVTKRQCQLTVFTSGVLAVPEPSVSVLVGLGLLSMLHFRRK